MSEVPSDKLTLLERYKIAKLTNLASKKLREIHKDQWEKVMARAKLKLQYVTNPHMSQYEVHLKFFERLHKEIEFEKRKASAG